MPDIVIEQLAKKVFEVALEHNSLNHWLSNLRVLSLFSRDTGLREKLENPEINPAEKTGEIERRLTSFSPELMELIMELIRKNRLGEADDLFIEYQRLMDEHLGIEGTETATIVTAVTLDSDFIREIGRKLTTITGKPVVIETRIDPAIIGGAVIKIGDKIIDGSVRRQLEALKKELSKTVR